MKNFILFSLACLLLVLGFLHFNQENEIVDLSSFTTTIAKQNDCIDDLEESLYHFSTENGLLKKQLSLLVDENNILTKKVTKFEYQIARLRKRVTNLELDVNSARTKVHILETEKSTKVKALVVSNNMENQTDKQDEELVVFDQIIADAKSDLKEKKQALTNVQKDLVKKETALSVTREEVSAKKKAIDVTQQKIEKTQLTKVTTANNSNAKIGSKATSIIASKETSKETLDEINKGNSQEEPKLYIVQSTEDKPIDNTGGIVSTAAVSEFSSKSPIYNLVENTSINYEYVSCRKDKFGRKIKKLNNKGKNWKFTFLQFNMENPVFSQLLEQNFRIKILDEDNESYVPVTVNRLVDYDECHDFVYEGEPIQLALYHEKDKLGRNFKVEIFLLDGEEEYLIEESLKDIFSEGLSLDNSL